MIYLSYVLNLFKLDTIHISLFVYILQSLNCKACVLVLSSKYQTIISIAKWYFFFGEKVKILYQNFCFDGLYRVN